MARMNANVLMAGSAGAALPRALRAQAGVDHQGWSRLRRLPGEEGRLEAMRGGVSPGSALSGRPHGMSVVALAVPGTPS
ncbi:hypothetical protein [Nitratidesulfovibrio vulgaris]|uniref:hypothetical protein n=1 Tax=Nitratidesulfovibrio vulgaris TaxID=881 RepID=UPI00123292C3|nr:hypothetical protein [Nitratidesulfovibrio vulgaris]